MKPLCVLLVTSSLALLGGEAAAQAHLGWLKPTRVGPMLQTGQIMAYDVVRRRAVLFGGSSAETWEWDGNNWKQRLPKNSPSARIGHAMAYDIADPQGPVSGLTFSGGLRLVIGY